LFSAAPAAVDVIPLVIVIFSALSGAYWQLSNIGFFLLLFHQWHEAILINRPQSLPISKFFCALICCHVRWPTVDGILGWT